MTQSPAARIAIRDVEIAYESIGQGVPLVAIHGFYPDRRLLTGCMEPCFQAEGRAVIPPSAGAGRPEGGLSVQTYRRIYPDLPFMGESSDPLSVQDSDGMLRVMMGFVDALIPEGPFLLVGESYGGYIARGLAREYGKRIAGMLLIAPLIIARPADRTRPEHRPILARDGYAQGAPSGYDAMFEEMAIVRDRYCFQRYTAEIVPGVMSARAHRLEELSSRGYAFSFDRMGALQPDGSEPPNGQPFDSHFDRPTLFVLGRQDASTGWRDALRLADRYPRASFAILDVAGHNLQIEQAGLFNALVGEWLGRCEAAI